MPRTPDTELVNSFSDKPFSLLIKHYLDTEGILSRRKLFKDAIFSLPKRAQEFTEAFIDRWNPEAYDKGFWQTQTADVFAAVTADAQKLFNEFGIQHKQQDLASMFDVIALNFAYAAEGQPKMREFMGLPKEEFPWPSALALLYPLAATLYIATQTPAPALMVIGYGVANLGYLLFAAGLAKGTFLIFKLRGRRKVFTMAAIAFALGSVLSNL